MREPRSVDPVNAVLNGRPAPFVPVAPVYEGLGPLECYEMELRRRKWWRRLEEAGRERLPVEFESYAALELEIHTDMLDEHYPRPAWRELPIIASVEDLDGCAVVRRGEDLFWVARDGRETWLPTSLAARNQREVVEGAARFAGLWERGWRGEQVEGPGGDVRESVGEPTDADVEGLLRSGRYEVARALLGRHPGEMPLYCYGVTPYWSLLATLGFQRMMTWLAERPRRVHEIIASRALRWSAELEAARRLGVGIAFVEECMASADLISPKMYREFVFPYTKQVLECYEAHGLRTVLYFSGNLMPLLEDLRELPWTALAFEEDRKNYGIDLGEVRRTMGPHRVVFGNVDAYLIERASDAEVVSEVRRQIDVAGGDGPFIVSPGSPFTPGTSLRRVRLFCESTRLV